MRYQLLHGLAPDRWDGYEDDQPLWLDPTMYDLGDDPIPPPRIVNALDMIFARHNRDDRPDGQIAPSLSGGDVIAVEVFPDTFRYYAVGTWNAVWPPENLVSAETWSEARTTPTED